MNYSACFGGKIEEKTPSKINIRFKKPFHNQIKLRSNSSSTRKTLNFNNLKQIKEKFNQIMFHDRSKAKSKCFSKKHQILEIKPLKQIKYSNCQISKKKASASQWNKKNNLNPKYAKKYVSVKSVGLLKDALFLTQKEQKNIRNLQSHIYFEYLIEKLNTQNQLRISKVKIDNKEARAKSTQINQKSRKEELKKPKMVSFYSNKIQPYRVMKQKQNLGPYNKEKTKNTDKTEKTEKTINTIKTIKTNNNKLEIKLSSTDNILSKKVLQPWKNNYLQQQSFLQFNDIA